MASFSASFLSDPVHHFPNPKPRFPLSHCLNRNVKFSTIVSAKCEDRNPSSRSLEWIESLKLPPDSFQKLGVSTVLFVGLSIRVCSAAASNRIPNVANLHTVVEEQKIQVTDDMKTSGTMENFEDEKSKAAFEKWKSRTYALTVPLRIVALRGSVPPSWIKDFTQSQGWRASLRSEIRGSLDEILSDLSTSFSKGNINPKSAVAADIVTVGDSWLNFAIKKGVIEPLQEIEDQDWFQGLSDKWKAYLCRNSEGNLDPEGKIWAAPYRWGSMVIAYKKSKFQKHNLAPIEDWADLWRPELAGKISMVDSPREVVGAVLKCMGASYNTTDIDAQVAGGRNALQLKLLQLKRQVRLFDSVHYLNALKGGDVWVAVGWSSDILPAAKRMSNISVIVPKSGASLWADLWAIPAASRLATSRIGGRVRGPSPLVHQWIEFCLQPARAMPFLQEVIPGASPFALGSPPIVESKELAKKKPKLDTNLVVGVPPAEILAHCEFLEPLSDAALADYQWLIAGMQEPPHLGLIQRMQHYILSVIQTLLPKTQSKVT